MLLEGHGAHGNDVGRCSTRNSFPRDILGKELVVGVRHSWWLENEGDSVPSPPICTRLKAWIRWSSSSTMGSGEVRFSSHLLFLRPLLFFYPFSLLCSGLGENGVRERGLVVGGG